MTSALVVLLLLAAGPPRGKPAPRPEPNRVVVRHTLLRAGDVTAQVARGVLARDEGGRVLLVGPVEIAGRVEPGALGLRVARDVDAHAPSGERIGTIRAGALVIPGGKAGGRTLCDVPGEVRARIAIDAAALGVAPAEFVWREEPRPKLEAQADAPLWAAPTGGAVRATLAAGAFVVVLDAPADVVHVRTYAELELEGYVPKKSFEPAQGAPARPPPPSGLNPTHEALVDTAVFADPAGKRRLGQLRGGALVTAGKDLSGGLRKVMTHGDVVVEVWVADRDLRALDAKNWAQGL
ncbi:MAG TPA: hypothetical protein VKE22_30040 [Haliangiales bacterium]|nr:hypothetical protein [Haliangiales bacterium]